MNTFLARTAAALALTFALGAQAAPVTQSFQLTFDFSSVAGLSAGSVINGSFGYDDAETPRFDAIRGETLYTMTSFALDFAGASYGLADLADHDVVFSGTQLLGLAASVTDTFTLLPSTGGNAAYFIFAPTGTRSFATASVTFGDRHTNVPEPATALLALAAAAAAIGASRRVRR